MNLLGIDLETTGLNPDKDKIIEIGYVLWDWQRSMPLRVVNDFVMPDSDFEVTEEITELTGIRKDDLIGHHAGNVSQYLTDMLNEFDSDHIEYVVAHNKDFEQSFLEPYCESDPYLNQLFNIPWICTMNDIPYPDSIKSKSLNYLAMEHGFINPFKHRGVFDVLTGFKVMSNYDFGNILEYRDSPLFDVVSYVPYERREEAKKAGFRWDADRKVWHYPIRKIRLESKDSTCKKGYHQKWEHLNVKIFDENGKRYD